MGTAGIFFHLVGLHTSAENALPGDYLIAIAYCDECRHETGRASRNTPQPQVRTPLRPLFGQEGRVGEPRTSSGRHWPGNCLCEVADSSVPRTVAGKAGSSHRRLESGSVAGGRIYGHRVVSAKTTLWYGLRS